MKSIKLFVPLALAIALIVPSFTNAELIGDFDPQGENACILLQNNLRYRSTDAQTNNEVSVLQDYLQANSYLDSNPTGFFGLLTFTAVKKFQTANGIEPTGFVGPLTRAKINLLTCGTPGNPVPPITPPSITPCSAGAFYNSETGAPCVNKTPTDSGCAYGAMYSSTTGAPCPGTIQPSITVLSPNGGEIWQKGTNETRTVKWSTSGVHSSNNMTVRLRSVATGQELLSSDQPNIGYAVIIIPSDFAEGKYTAEVKTSVNGQSYIDSSNSYFTITDTNGCLPGMVYSSTTGAFCGSGISISGLKLTATPATDGSVHVNASFDPNKYDPISVTLNVGCPLGVSAVYGSPSSISSQGSEACNRNTAMDPIAGPGAYRNAYTFTNTTGSPQRINFQAAMNGPYSFNVTYGPLGYTFGNYATAYIDIPANSTQPSIAVSFKSASYTVASNGSRDVKVDFSWNANFTPSAALGAALHATNGDMLGVRSLPSSSAGDASITFNSLSTSVGTGGYYYVDVYDRAILGSTPYFTISSASSPLTVVSPNGGEKWMLNSGQTVITWTPDPHSTSVEAYLERLVNGQFVNIGKVIAVGKGSIPWGGEIDQYAKYAPPDSGYYIRLVNAQTGATDRSDQPFTLLPIDYVKVDLKIDGGDAPVSVPASGRNVTISWTSQNATSCAFYPTDLGPILTNLPTSGSRSVFIKGNSYSYNYALSMLCDSPYGGRSDYVEVFPSSPTAPSVLEQIKCVFNNSTTEQQCYSTDGVYKFSGVGTAGGDIGGAYGAQMTWKSSCGGYAYTTFDGNNEYANFSCATIQPIIFSAAEYAQDATSIKYSINASFDPNKYDPVSVVLGITCPPGISGYYNDIPVCNGAMDMSPIAGPGAYRNVVKFTNTTGTKAIVNLKMGLNSLSGSNTATTDISIPAFTTSTSYTQTVSLTANGSRDVTLNVGDTLKYAWSSTKGGKFSSYYTSSPTSCGSGASVMNSSSGSYSWVVPKVSSGCTYTVTYYVNLYDDGSKGGAKDTVVVRVNKTATTTTQSVNNTNTASALTSFEQFLLWLFP